MNIRDIIKISASEKDCENYLREKGVLKRFDNCIKCGHLGPKRIRRDRYKCYKCKAEWSVRSDSFLKTVNITYAQFLLCLKMIDLEISIEKNSEETGISQKTIRKIYNVLNERFSNRKKSKRNPVRENTSTFCISHIDNQIKVEQLEQVEQDRRNDNQFYVFGIRRRDSGSNVFYDFQTSKDLRRNSKSIRVHGQIGNFWSFATERLIRFNGSVEVNLFTKLKEIELRFNCIQEKKDIFETLLEFYKVRK